MSYQLPDLPYNYDSLEPHIDARTMEIHHDKHHAGYVKKLNNAIDSQEGLKGKPLDELIASINDLPEDVSAAVRNNGGGHYNHSLFWPILSPEGGGEPEGHIGGLIKENFGSFGGFKETFNKAATTRFGSGWAWLVAADDVKLAVCSTANQDNPIMDVVEQQGRPILGLDVWEHAYYLKYQNKRADYIEAFWNLVNWKAVEANYTEAVKKLETAGVS